MPQVLSDLNKAAGELGLGPRPLSVAANKEEGELEITVKDGLTGDRAARKSEVDRDGFQCYSGTIEVMASSDRVVCHTSFWPSPRSRLNA